MKKLLMLLSTAALIGPVGAAAGKENAKDQEAIKEIEAHWQDAWNRHDMKAFAALVSEDVDFITVAGIWLKGRAEFESHHARMHQMQFRDSMWTTVETQIRFLKPDVAVVHVRWGITGDRDPDGTPRQPRRGVFTRVVMKRGGS